jgi:hypothetical protein
VWHNDTENVSANGPSSWKGQRYGSQPKVSSSIRDRHAHECEQSAQAWRQKTGSTRDHSDVNTSSSDGCVSTLEALRHVPVVKVRFYVEIGNTLASARSCFYNVQTKKEMI